MRSTLLVVAVGLVAGVLAGMIFHAQAWEPMHRDTAAEKWLDANHLKVLTGTGWQDVELMPLADHLCQGRQPMFRRYCADPS